MTELQQAGLKLSPAAVAELHQLEKAGALERLDFQSIAHLLEDLNKAPASEKPGSEVSPTVLAETLRGHAKVKKSSARKTSRNHLTLAHRRPAKKVARSRHPSSSTSLKKSKSSTHKKSVKLLSKKLKRAASSRKARKTRSKSKLTSTSKKSKKARKMKKANKKLHKKSKHMAKKHMMKPSKRQPLAFLEVASEENKTPIRAFAKTGKAKPISSLATKVAGTRAATSRSRGRKTRHSKKQLPTGRTTASGRNGMSDLRRRLAQRVADAKQKMQAQRNSTASGSPAMVTKTSQQTQTSTVTVKKSEAAAASTTSSTSAVGGKKKDDDDDEELEAEKADSEKECRDQCNGENYDTCAGYEYNEADQSCKLFTDGYTPGRVYEEKEPVGLDTTEMVCAARFPPQDDEVDEGEADEEVDDVTGEVDDDAAPATEGDSEVEEEEDVADAEDEDPENEGQEEDEAGAEENAEDEEEQEGDEEEDEEEMLEQNEDKDSDGIPGESQPEIGGVKEGSEPSSSDAEANDAAEAQQEQEMEAKEGDVLTQRKKLAVR